MKDENLEFSRFGLLVIKRKVDFWRFTYWKGL